MALSELYPFHGITPLQYIDVISSVGSGRLRRLLRGVIHGLRIGSLQLDLPRQHIRSLHCLQLGQKRDPDWALDQLVRKADAHVGSLVVDFDSGALRFRKRPPKKANSTAEHHTTAS